MSEEIGSLHIALKLIGLNASEQGIRDFEAMLKKTGQTAEQFAENLRNMEQAARKAGQAQVNLTTFVDNLAAGNKILLQLFREGEQTSSRYATASERLGMQMQAVNQQWQAGAIGATAYGRAMDDLKTKMDAIKSRESLDARSSMAMAFGTASPIGGGSEKADYYKDRDAFILATNKAITKEKEIQNSLELQTFNLKRQLESPEQAHVRRQGEYNALLKRNLIDQEQLNRLVAISANTMRSQTAGGGKGGGQMAFQAAYGVQDFATVVAMGGGVGRGLMSAQNNLSQMLMVSSALNPALAAMLGTMSALTAIGIGLWWDQYSAGAGKAKDKTEEVTKAIERMMVAMDVRLSGELGVKAAERTGTRGKAAEIESAIRSRRDSIEDRGIDVASSMETERRARESIIRNDTNLRKDAADAGRAAAVKFRMNAADSEGNISFEDVRKSEALGRQAEADFIESALRDNQKLKDIIEKRVKTQQEITNDEAAIAILTKSLVGKKEAEEKEAREKHDAAVDSRSLEKRTRGAMTAQSSVEAAMRASGRQLSIATGTGTAAGFGMEDSLTEFIKGLSEAKGIGAKEKVALLEQFGMNQSGMIDKDIANLKKQNSRRPEASFQSFQGFGQSLQLSLLKQPDEAKEQRERQIALLEQQKTALDAIKDAAERGFVGMAGD